MEKYTYRQKDDKQTKTAAVEGRCPVCGKATTGSPPVCQTHGSTPFEERRGKEKD